jgi:hypothetical protein
VEVGNALNSNGDFSDDSWGGGGGGAKFLKNSPETDIFARNNNRRGDTPN